MSKSTFKIGKGKFDVPNVGKVNAFEKVNDATLYKLYLLPRKVFPWIELTEEGLAYIKKQKPTVKEVSSMVLNAVSPEEAEQLSTLTESVTVQNILKTKLESFKK